MIEHLTKGDTLSLGKIHFMVASSLLILALISQSRVEAAANDNVREFETLGSIYEVALKEPLTTGDENASAVAEKSIAHLKQVLGRFQTIASRNESAYDAIQDTEWKREYPYLRSQRTESLARHLKRLSQATQRLESNVFKWAAAYESARINAKKHLRKAVFGQNLGEKMSSKTTEQLRDEQGSTDSFSGGSYAAICGTDPNVGSSLIADLCCICGLASESSNSPECGIGAHSIGNFNNADTGRQRWDKLRPHLHAKKFAEGLRPTPSNILHLVATFKGLLGSHVIEATGISNGNPAQEINSILGIASTATNAKASCDGVAQAHNAAHGICVNYFERHKKGSEIPWVKELMDAAGELSSAKKIEGQLITAVDDSRRIESAAIAAYDSVESGETQADASKAFSPNGTATDVRVNPASTIGKELASSAAPQQAERILIATAANLILLSS